MEASTGKSVAYFCPACGSSSVEFGTLTGSKSKCNACEWEGRVEQLMQHAFDHEHGSDENVVREMMNDFRKLYAANTQGLAMFLVKWGFLATLDTKVITRYLAAMSAASLTAVLRVRQEIEKERVNGGS